MELIQMAKITESEYTFADLVDAYSTPVYRLCRRLTYSKEDADDLFQEAFLKAFEQQAKLMESDNPEGFLFSTAVYTWKSWQRKYARRKRLAPAGPLDEAPAEDMSLEDDMEAQEENRVIRELVKDLPDKIKIPTILYYSMEMSTAEIAKVMKLPVGTVKSRLSRARKLVEKGLVAVYGA